MFHQTVFNTAPHHEMGEELNTPVICSSEPKFDQTNLNTQHSQNIQITDTQLVTNNKNNNINNISNIILQSTTSATPIAATITTTTATTSANHTNNNFHQLPKPINPKFKMADFMDNYMEPYSVESNVSDEQPLFNTFTFDQLKTPFATTPTSTTTSNSESSSPLGGLNTNDMMAEQSFIFESTSNGSVCLPIKMCSQDYEHSSIFDEINANLGDDANQIIIKNEDTFNNNYNNNNNNTDLINHMYNPFGQTKNSGISFDIYDDEEDSCLETVDNFRDVMINGYNSNLISSQSNINNNINKSPKIENIVENIILTPAPSPEPIQSANKIDNKFGNSNLINNNKKYCENYSSNKKSSGKNLIRICLSNSNVSEVTNLQQILQKTNVADNEMRLKLEHNYNINENNNNTNILKNNNQLKRKIVAPSTVLSDNNIIQKKLNCKRKLVMDDNKIKQHIQLTTSTLVPQQENMNRNNERFVPPLKIKLNASLLIKEDMESTVSVSTPDITNDIMDMEMDMECDKFDLISYINSSQNSNIPNDDYEHIKTSEQTTIPEDTKTNILPLQTGQSSIENVLRLLKSNDETYTPLEAFDPSQSNNSIPAETEIELINSRSISPIPRKRQRLDSYDNPSSVQSTSSTIQSSLDDYNSCNAFSTASSTPVHSSASTPSSAAPKRRGRPPKTSATPISPSVMRNMSEADLRYAQMRYKNNEASRKSRLNRKDRETTIEDEAQLLEERNSELVAEELKLTRSLERWQKKVMQLAMI